MKPTGPRGMMAAVSDSMRSRTGRTVQEWVALVETSGLDSADQLAVRRWLKSEHGIPQNSQWAIADAAAQASGWIPPTVEEQVTRQYEGTKAALRPIFDALREIAESLGDDVTMGGRSTYTPFTRGRQFMAVSASTRTRVDVGLRLSDPPDSDLLTLAKAPGQATHKLSLSDVEQVSDEVRFLLRAAYDQNG